MLQVFFNPLQDQAGIEEKGRMGGKEKSVIVTYDMNLSCWLLFIFKDKYLLCFIYHGKKIGVILYIYEADSSFIILIDSHAE